MIREALPKKINGLKCSCLLTERQECCQKFMENIKKFWIHVLFFQEYSFFSHELCESPLYFCHPHLPPNFSKTPSSVSNHSTFHLHGHSHPAFHICLSLRCWSHQRILTLSHFSKIWFSSMSPILLSHPSENPRAGPVGHNFKTFPLHE